MKYEYQITRNLAPFKIAAKTYLAVDCQIYKVKQKITALKRDSAFKELLQLKLNYS